MPSPEASSPQDGGQVGAEAGIDLARAALAAARSQAKTRTAQAQERRRARGGGRRSGARPDERDPQRLGAAVERLVTERGWERPVAVAGVIGRWADIVGREVAAHCQPEGLEDGVLRIRADSATWATQVRWLSRTLLGRLGVELGAGVVTRITVLGPATAQRSAGRLRAPGSTRSADR